MKVHKSICILFLFVILVSCNKRIDLNEDALLSQIFNRNEIREMELMVDFVDKMVLINTGKTDINEAYHVYLENLKHKKQQGSNFPVPFDQEVKYHFLERLDPRVFKEIWNMNDHAGKVRIRDTVYSDLQNFKSLSFNYAGLYMNYLKSLGHSDRFFKLLHEGIETAGDIPPTMMTWFLLYHGQFDFTVPKNRLWAAIYLLSMEETIDKKMERYLKSKNPYGVPMSTRGWGGSSGVMNWAINGFYAHKAYHDLIGTDFINLGEAVSGNIPSTNLAGGFTGCLLGLYATLANDAIPE